MNEQLKHLVKSGLNRMGLDVRRLPRGGAGAGTTSRPIGSVLAILQDIKARGYRPAGIVDVGANRGEWTEMAKSVFPDARFLLVEPLDEMRPFLERLVSPHVEYLQVGLGASDGRGRLTITADLAGSSFLSARDQEGVAGTREVELLTLDSILAERSDFSPDIVKMDIQGYEIEALKGATSASSRVELFILETALFEVWPGQPLVREVISHMGERGFELYDVADYVRRPADGALGNLDLCFAREGGFLRRYSGWE